MYLLPSPQLGDDKSAVSKMKMGNGENFIIIIHSFLYRIKILDSDTV